MKLRILALAGAALLLATPALAGQGWYLGLGAGWDHMNDPRVTGAGLDGKLGTRDGGIVAGTFGYKFASRFRLEAELGWDRHTIRSFDAGAASFPASGHAETRSFLINGIYDFHVLPRLNLSLGAGAGIGRNEFRFDTGGIAYSTGSRARFMWQGIGGLSFEASPNLDLFVDYHYRSLQGASGNALSSFPRAQETHEHVVMAGLRWYPWSSHEERVEQVAYQPPPPPPPPPPAPPPPPPVKTFIVFFDFNKSNLTPEAQNVVSEAVKAAQQSGPVRLLITGHTDTVGSDSYNQGLSERRAGSVKDEMIREGMSADQISTVGKSFHDPLVPTGPGVREPQNRRAVIDLGG